jgi:hypothetical protein
MILGISHSKVPIYFRTGPEHPTPNNQHRTSNQRASGRQWMFNFEAIAFADTAYTPIEELTRSDVTLNPQPSTFNPPLTPVGKDDFRGGGEGQTGCGNLGLHDFSLTTCGRIVQTLSGGVFPSTRWRAKAQRLGLDHQPGTHPNGSICYAF